MSETSSNAIASPNAAASHSPAAPAAPSVPATPTNPMNDLITYYKKDKAPCAKVQWTKEELANVEKACASGELTEEQVGYIQDDLTQYEIVYKRIQRLFTFLLSTQDKDKFYTTISRFGLRVAKECGKTFLNQIIAMTQAIVKNGGNPQNGAGNVGQFLAENIKKARKRIPSVVAPSKHDMFVLDRFTSFQRILNGVRDWEDVQSLDI